MIKNLKIGKLLRVCLITLLIWIWADKALDETLTVANTKISVSKTLLPDLLVILNQGKYEDVSGEHKER